MSDEVKQVTLKICPPEGAALTKEHVQAAITDDFVDKMYEILSPATEGVMVNIKQECDKGSQGGAGS